MKIVVNRDYGGFCLSERFFKQYPQYDLETDRNNPDFIIALECFGLKEASDDCVLEIIEIPDEVTDWEIDENDGFEDVIYVLNGLIHHA